MSSALLPPNATQLERALADTPELDRLAPEVIATLWNPWSCPAPQLPWLAWALSVDVWDATWDEATQRRVIAASIEIHRKKGTVGAVRDALTSLGHAGRLVEWWQTQPKGVPHTFLAEVEIDNRGIDVSAVGAIEEQIIAVKPVRSHFSLRLVGRSNAPVALACQALSGELVSINPYQVTQLDAEQVPHVGIGQHSWETASVYPLH